MILDDTAPEIRAASEKLLSSHFERLAVVYVRQSTARQVLENEESTRLQYGLVAHARDLGWPQERILVIDDDLGLSAADSEGRAGFRRLVSEVGLDHVGIILGVEMSRLARSSKDWHQLLEICALFGTLIADLDGIYDPASYNDRLLLGLKGTMSEAELHTIKQRMQQGKLNKARRGELGFAVPTGYVRHPSAEVAFDPDEEVRQVISLIFRKFEELGTLNAVLRYLVENGIRIGIRVREREAKGKLEWHPPNRMTLQTLLKHPIYAGAYAYGRRRIDPRKKKPGRPSTGKTVSPPEEWHVLIKDRFPAYISWEHYERNLARLEANRAVADAKGAPREGASLLQGLLICGKCGARMALSYSANGKHSYLCSRLASDYGGESCQHLAGAPLDEFVGGKVLEALEPAALELSLEAAQNVQREREELDRLWHKRMERASYEAERAGRHYRLLEPENRLVARQLAREWEEKLADKQKLGEDYRRFQSEKPRLLSLAEREDIRRLAEDIPALWSAASTTNKDRKEIVRQVIERVVIEVEVESERVRVEICWAGGTQTTGTAIRPVARFEQLSYYPKLCERIRQLAARGLTTKAVARCLDEEGYRSPRHVRGFGAQGVRELMRRLGLSRRGQQAPGSRDGLLLGEHEWWLKELAGEVRVPVATLYGWARRGWVKARQLQQQPRRWVAWADEAELERLRQLHELPRGYHTRRLWFEPEGGSDDASR